MEYVFIGGGNMGRSMASALIGQGVCKPNAILVVEPDPANREAVAQMGCEVAEGSGEEVGEAPVVVLAVKPQSSQQVFGQLQNLLKPTQVVVSIMAGITLAAIRAGINHQSLVRVMPNTPAQVGLGMNVYFPDPAITAQQLGPVESLLKASGEVLAVESEDAIDAATAISGSGPAYVFYMAEHWLKAAVQLGFSQDDAVQMVQQTLLGATALWKGKNIPVGTLREQVTSKGGTTAAALEYFEATAVGENLEKGINKAYLRAKELGEQPS